VEKKERQQFGEERAKETLFMKGSDARQGEED